MVKEYKMIDPFVDGQVRKDPKSGEPCVSYGLSSYGYDIRVAREFKIFTNVYNSIVDPKNFSEDAFVDMVTDVCVMPPHSFALCRSVEHIRMPRSVLAICISKSTYARCGIIVNVTPFEPESEGYVTIEISNTTPLPVKIYANEGIAQVIFWEATDECEVSYADRVGKYMKQKEVTLPKV